MKQSQTREPGRQFRSSGLFYASRFFQKLLLLHCKSRQKSLRCCEIWPQEAECISTFGSEVTYCPTYWKHFQFVLHWQTFRLDRSLASTTAVDGCRKSTWEMDFTPQWGHCDGFLWLTTHTHEMTSWHIHPHSCSQTLCQERKIWTLHEGKYLWGRRFMVQKGPLGESQPLDFLLRVLVMTQRRCVYMHFLFHWRYGLWMDVVTQAETHGNKLNLN